MACNDGESMRVFKDELGKRFSIVELGPVSQFLGTNIVTNGKKGSIYVKPE